jgi:hypothetical protein
MDAAMGETIALHLDQVERLDRTIVSLETRRNSLLREIDRHRGTRATALRRAAKDAEDAEDAEFEEVGPAADEEKAQ